MEKFIKIIKAIFSLGYTVYLEYKQKQKEIDSLIEGTQEIFNYINNVRNRVMENVDDPKQVLKHLDIKELKLIAKDAQTRFGTAKHIYDRLEYLYKNNKLREIN